jgi:cytidine deaminase
MAGINRFELVQAAARARNGAFARYSKFKVGAALLTKQGEIITGANVESASYGLTCCAERVALFAALTGGKKDFAAVAVVARAGRADAVRGLPATSRRIRSRGGGLGGG